MLPRQLGRFGGKAPERCNSKSTSAMVGALVFAAAPTAFANQSQTCDMGRSITLTGANSLWPPNHKYHPYTVSALGNPMDTHADVMTTVGSDEPDVGVGAGGPQHDQD